MWFMVEKTRAYATGFFVFYPKIYHENIFIKLAAYSVPWTVWANRSRFSTYR